ncbi:hypothetical protein HAX54_012442 [Datura stramonium]|uniref:Bulb-type lectin domain-containing protein n=1 Tax=Datura stramonium TaxID=4076 RepID=A0ABS8TMN6_DATST|nr:hypothetical protein [Datura stramonium]
MIPSCFPLELNHPVLENGTLQLLQDGDLVLKDVDGTLVWSTGTANKFVSGIKMMETGNLVLHDMYNQTVWQTFDHPTDALLPGQKLKAGLFAFYMLNKPQMYFKFLVSGERDSFDESYVKAVNGTLALYISSTEPNEPNAVFSRPSRMNFLRYDYDGHLRAYTEGSDQPNDLLADFIGFCDYPTACGSLELCSNGVCSCPGAFRKSNDRQNNGCVEVSPVECDGQRSHRMVRVSDVYYFNYVDIDAAALRGTDEESCQELCLKNCSCKVVLFRKKTLQENNDDYSEEKSGLLRFSYELLKMETGNFQKKLGQGEKADVYSFGIVAMEILCGRKNVDYSNSLEHPHLFSLFMEKAENNQLIDMIGNYSDDDPQCNTSEVIRMMKLAVWCLQSDFTLRPSMSMVVKVLEGTMDIESHLDYSVPNSQTIAAIKRVSELDTTSTLFPSILSGPR